MAALFSVFLLSLSHAAPVKTPHAEVELLAEQSALVPGQSIRLGLSIKHAPHWHTYWKNPGDSGYPTKVTWELPAGYSVSGFDWPVPSRLRTGPIVNFGYEGEVLLPATLKVPANATVGSSVTLKGKAEWLVCKDVCIPEDGDVAITLPVANTAIASSANAKFATSDAAIPKPLPGWSAEARVHSREMFVALTPPPTFTGTLKKFDVFPEVEQITEPAVQKTFKTPSGFGAMLKLVDGAKVPDSFELVLASPDLIGASKGFGTITVATKNNNVAQRTEGFVLLADSSTETSVGTSASPNAGAQTLNDPNAMSLIAALLFAFVGGMILNLMPCVFPVLSLKILSFAQHAGAQHPQRAQGAAHNAIERRGAMRAHGVFYAVGVIVSFLILAGGLLALKSAGSAVGWGFQLQNPGVVWVLAVIFFLIGLNLMGAFEIGTLAPSALLNFTAKKPGVDAFFSGVLAVIAASPCTAPFMGAALGFALTQNAFAALAVFAMLGVGMALPYVILAWFPKWLDRLPRPGPWMVTFKQVLAFPMFLTVVWLIWVIAQQATIDGAAIALVGLVGLSFGAWLLGSMKARARVAGALASVLAILLAWPTTALVEANAAQGATASSSAQWKPWSVDEIAKLNAEGKPVFVDFTAAWCVSCQANKRLVLTRADVEKAFADKNVVLMRADWTNRDERITQALTQMNRSGVPVYALHAPGKPVQLLPELLTAGIVKDALARL